MRVIQASLLPTCRSLVSHSFLHKLFMGHSMALLTILTSGSIHAESTIAYQVPSLSYQYAKVSSSPMFQYVAAFHCDSSGNFLGTKPPQVWSTFSLHCIELAPSITASCLLIWTHPLSLHCSFKENCQYQLDIKWWIGTKSSLESRKKAIRSLIQAKPFSTTFKYMSGDQEASANRENSCIKVQSSNFARMHLKSRDKGAAPDDFSLRSRTHLIVQGYPVGEEAIHNKTNRMMASAKTSTTWWHPSALNQNYFLPNRTNSAAENGMNIPTSCLHSCMATSHCDENSWLSSDPGSSSSIHSKSGSTINASRPAHPVPRLSLPLCVNTDFPQQTSELPFSRLFRGNGVRANPEYLRAINNQLLVAVHRKDVQLISKILSPPHIFLIRIKTAYLAAKHAQKTRQQHVLERIFEYSDAFDCYEPIRAPLLVQLITAHELQLTRKLLQYDHLDCNATTVFGMTPLMFAAQLDDSRFLTALLLRGCLVNQTSAAGKSAIMYAIHHHRLRNLKYLIRAGADLNLRERSGKTPLFLAEEVRSFNTYKQLLIAGANPNLRLPGTYETVLMHAAKEGLSDFVQITLDYGCFIDAQNHDGETALMLALKHHAISTAIILLQRGAGVHYKTYSSGLDAFTIAQRNGLHSFLDYLQTFAPRHAHRS